GAATRPDLDRWADETFATPRGAVRRRVGAVRTLAGHDRRNAHRGSACRRFRGGVVQWPAAGSTRRPLRCGKGTAAAAGCGRDDRRCGHRRTVAVALLRTT